MNFTPIQLAYGSLVRQKKRAILTMLAIAIGIAAVITISAAGAGLRRLVLGQIDIFGASTFHIETRVPSSKSSGGFGSVGITITTLKEKDVIDMLKLPNVEAAEGEVSGQEIVSYNGQISKSLLSGAGYSSPEVQVLEFQEGRFYTKDEEDSLAQVAVLGPKTKQKLFGDDTAEGKTIYIKGKPFRVIGVLKPRGAAFFFDLDNMVMLPTKTMQKRLLGIDYYVSISGKFKDVNQSESTAKDIAYILRENHNIADEAHDDFVVQTTVQAQSSLSAITSGITLLLIALVCISLIVGGVGIMNIMYVSVAERTFEIGLRKSLGAKGRDILGQFLAEAVLVTLGGGVVGVVLGALLALLIYLGATAAGFKWVFSISLSSIILSVCFSGFIGLLFGLYPAKKAAALNPIEALRKE